MLTLITDRNILCHERGVPSPVKLRVKAQFRNPKELDLFLNPDRPWISVEEARRMVNDQSTACWWGLITNVKGFSISSKSGRDETGLVPVRCPLRCIVHKVNSPNGKQYMRVRLITGSRDDWKEVDLPKRFKVLPSPYVPDRS